MKKLLALLLAALILVGFGVGAGAEETQEELEAEGRALLMETMEMLRGEYTLEHTNENFWYAWYDNYPYNHYTGVIHKAGEYVLIRDDGVRDIYFKDKVLRVYPDRNAYHSKLVLSPWLHLLEPKIITDDTPIRAERYSSSRGNLWVYVEDLRYSYNRTTGALVEIGQAYGGGYWEFEIPNFRKRRNDVWSGATVCDNVMNPVFRTHVLAHHVHGHIEELHRVKCAASIPWVRRRVSAYSTITYFEIVHGKRRRICNPTDLGGMP